MSKPEPGTIFKTASAILSATPATPHAAAPQVTEPKLSDAARAVAAEPYEAAFSPIVLAGLVRVIEVALVAAVGFVVYVSYAAPQRAVWPASPKRSRKRS